MQGGIGPELPGTAYFDLVTAVKRRVPEVHVHAFSPDECPQRRRPHRAPDPGLAPRGEGGGLDTIPGTAAEILDDDVRWVLTRGKLPTRAWVEVVTAAHELAIRSSATIMYGHVDHPRHWVAHLWVLARIQDRTGGFTEFVPLPFVHTSAALYMAGVARPGPTHRDNLAVHAVARIMRHSRIATCRRAGSSWVSRGPGRCCGPGPTTSAGR